MAKVQTRRSISMQRAKHVRLFALAKQLGIPAAQIVEQAIEAVFDGRVQLRIEPLRITVTPPRIYPGGTCAACVAEIPTSTDVPIMAPWGRNDAPVRICAGCFGQRTEAV